MADDIAVSEGSGKTVGTKDIGGKQFQKILVSDPTTGTPVTPAVLGTAAMAASVPVTLATDDTQFAALLAKFKNEDAAHASADAGIPAWGVRKLTPVNTSGTDGDYEPFQVSTGQLHVNAGHWQGVTNGVLATAFATVSGSGNTNGLDALASGGAATSSTGFDQTNTLGAKEAYVYYISGDTTWTPAGAGANIAVWFLLSVDGGSTYESAQNTASTTVPALSRPPDAVIPLDLVATGTGGVKKFATGRVKLPSGTFKVVAQNNGGATMGDTTTTHAGIYIAPIA